MREQNRSREQGSVFLSALVLIGFSVAAVGLLAFLSGVVIASYEGNKLRHVELPFGDAQGIAVDQESRIYIGSRSYRRVSRYSGSGAFERSWHIPQGKGEWRIAIDEEGSAYLKIGEGEHAIYFRLSAEEAEPIDSTEVQFSQEADMFIAGDRRTYLINPLAQVEVIGLEGDSKYIGPPLYLRLLGSPLPAWLFAFVGFVLFGESLRRLKNVRR